MKLFGCMIAMAMVVGCSKMETSVLPAKPVIDSSTPDRALKSYWSVKTWIENSAEELDRKGILSELERESQEMIEKVKSDQTSDAKPKYVAEMFSREIKEVKVESESRAVIFAVVKNIAPIPEGLTPKDYELEARKDGDALRYVLEKYDSGWKIVELWRYEGAVQAEWRQYWPYVRSKSVPYLAHRGW